MALVGKDQLVHEVAEKSGLGVGEARRALEEMLTAIETQLAEGNEVRLTGFGKFSVSRRKAREGRNPQTGESMRIAAKKVPRFSAGAELREAVPQATKEGRAKSKPKARRKPGSESPNEAEQADNGRGDAASEDLETGKSQGKRSKRTSKRATTRRKPDASAGRAAPGDEGARDSSGGDEKESAETGAAAKVISAAASGAKVAVVAAAGLAAGFAGARAIMQKR